MDHRFCITQTASTIDTLLGVPCRPDAAPPLDPVLKAAAAAGITRCRRVVVFNPDAVALWVREKHADLFAPLDEMHCLPLDLLSVVPPVTPVCFASMYSGLQPVQHGIRRYEKPVLAVPTVFDDLPAAGLRAAIVSTAGDSISKIFLGRPVDYYIYPSKEQCNQRALQLIAEDRYSLIVLYNGDYDHWMHRFGPEGARPLRALRENVETWRSLAAALGKRAGSGGTVLAFAPDHGCHRRFGVFGTHGEDIPLDMEIRHEYAFL